MSDRVIILTKRPALVKDVISIDLTSSDKDITPTQRRELPEFRHYFNNIWKELDVHDK